MHISTQSARALIFKVELFNLARKDSDLTRGKILEEIIFHNSFLYYSSGSKQGIFIYFMFMSFKDLWLSHTHSIDTSLTQIKQIEQELVLVLERFVGVSHTHSIDSSLPQIKQIGQELINIHVDLIIHINSVRCVPLCIH